MGTHYQRCILMIDDDPEDREMLCEAIDKIDSGISCLHAVNGEDALHFQADAS